MRTTITTGDIKTVKKWRAALMRDTFGKSYFHSKFISASQNAVIQQLKDLENDAGDNIQFDLTVQLRGKATYGDDRLEGKAEALRYYTDNVKIDQARKAVDSGGRMTRKRTIHDLRANAKEKLSSYWSKFLDEICFMYLSGARGINEDFFESATYVGHAGNAFQAPDAAHLLMPGVKVKATLASTDKMDRELIERSVAATDMMRAKDPTTANMNPIDIDGGKHYVLVMSPYQAYDLRNSDTNGWVEINKMAGDRGGKNRLFKNSLGMLGDVVLHKHASTIRFNDYGAGGNVEAARALLMGQQAGVVAYGQSGGMRFNWNEEEVDHNNGVEISAGLIFGAKKTRFNNKDFGLMSLDTAAASPN